MPHINLAKKYFEETGRGSDLIWIIIACASFVSIQFCPVLTICTECEHTGNCFRAKKGMK